MLTEKQVQDICAAELRELRLINGCKDFVSALRSGNDVLAAERLRDCIQLSITRCVHATLKQNK